MWRDAEEANIVIDLSEKKNNNKHTHTQIYIQEHTGVYLTAPAKQNLDSKSNSKTHCSLVFNFLTCESSEKIRNCAIFFWLLRIYLNLLNNVV